MNVELELAGLGKRYGQRWVVRSVSLTARSGQVIGIVGSNGSGKSTLMKLIAGILRADSGECTLRVDDSEIDSSQRHLLCGLVAPYLAIYDEFNPAEHLRMHAQLHGSSIDESHVQEVLGLVGLASVQSRPIRSYSSGMRQRVSIALALCLLPPLLLLDEPGVTLDEAGRMALTRCIDVARQQGSVVILATNDERERGLCDTIVELP